MRWVFLMTLVPFRSEMQTPNEERSIALGADLLGRILVVVYTYRGERIRIISARRATPSERETYEGAT